MAQPSRRAPLSHLTSPSKVRHCPVPRANSIASHASSGPLRTHVRIRPRWLSLLLPRRVAAALADAAPGPHPSRAEA